MTTSTHVLIALAAVWPGRNASARRLWPAVTAGALIPDLAMFLFYAVERLRGTAESTIWSDRYHDPGWQLVFDLPNSLPLIGLAALLSWLVAARRGLALCAAMALHAVVDFATHHDDAHRHFWPLSDFHFRSPVSYWDPNHYGAWASALELIAAFALCAWVFRRHPEKGARITGVACLGSLFAFAAFARYAWGA